MTKTDRLSGLVPQPETVAVIRPALGEFFPFEVLWSPHSDAPIFNSEGAARWFFRNNRAQLVAAHATVIHTGRVLVHPARCAVVAEAVALENARKRVPGACA